MGIYVNFTKTTHQIWSCHVTLAEILKIFIFLPNSVLNFGKSYQLWGNWYKNKNVTDKKQNWGVANTPPLSAYKVKQDNPMIIVIIQFV